MLPNILNRFNFRLFLPSSNYDKVINKNVQEILVDELNTFYECKMSYLVDEDEIDKEFW